MSIQGVVFSAESAAVRAEVDSPLTLNQAFPGDQPAAIVVPAAELASFVNCHDKFKSLPTKHPAKPLGKLLLGHNGRIPVIDTGYSSLGRLQQGIETLFDSAKEAGERGPWVLGVNGRVFLEAWRSVGPATATPNIATPAEASISELMEQLPVPEKLGARFLGDSEDHQLVRQLILRAALVETPVLILGDTGTGKNIVARSIHDFSRRRNGPYKVVNCAAIPNQLIESELFGHMRGAFTDAYIDKRGQWEDAQDGTLFLDEIGELLPEHQAKILHVLQDGYICRVGGLKEIAVNARVIAATNRNLYGLVQSGRFREDLYYRLRQFVIRTPRLHDPKVLAQIAQSIWHKIANTDQDLPREIIEDLCHHRWPGNVRELRSVLVSLENYFGAKPLRRDHLRAVFSYCGKSVSQDSGQQTSDDIAGLRVECVRQLRRVEELIRACEEILKPLLADECLNLSQRESLQRSCLDLKSALRGRLQFHSKEAYETVKRLETDLENLLAHEPGDGHWEGAFWKEILAPDVESAVSQLFEQLQALLGEL